VTEGFDYPALVREAMIGVVRSVLAQTAEAGLPGDHHFFITFRTETPGVEIPAGLKRQHPQEMTIVLQHQFWGLEVAEGHFAVSLRFGGALQRLVVPFVAVCAFVDPSAEFGLRLLPALEPVTEEPAEAEPTDQPPAAPDSGNVVPFSPVRNKR
jgi:uncharacterized protein